MTLSEFLDEVETVLAADATYVPSEDVVARDIEGEIIIVPLTAGMGDTDDALYTLNETGQAIWSRLDGQRSMRALVGEMVAQFDAAESEIEADVLGLVGELLRRRMLVEAC